ncbi:MAG: galactokinase family protein [Halanaerobiales bacterium]
MTARCLIIERDHHMQTLINKFTQKYNNNKKDIKIARSPLRICPLGAHVDHQEGLTGMALDSTVLTWSLLLMMMAIFVFRVWTSLMRNTFM